MMHCVRKWIHTDQESRDFQVLQPGLDSLCQYLQTRLGHEIHATLKRSEGDTMLCLVRDSGQHLRRSAPEKLIDNYVFGAFKAKPQEQDDRWIFVGDVRKVDGSHYERFRNRAKKRRYRSVLALPLRFPSQSIPKIPGVLLGFLGLDSAAPHAFDDLFEWPANTDQLADNTAEDCKPKDEMHLLFALADSMATIISTQVPNPDAAEAVSEQTSLSLQREEP
jgi:hypothetical protein